MAASIRQDKQKETWMISVTVTPDDLETFVANYGLSMDDPELMRRVRWYKDACHEEASRLTYALRTDGKEAEKKVEEWYNRKMAGKLLAEGIAPDIIERVTGIKCDDRD